MNKTLVFLVLCVFSLVLAACNGATQTSDIDADVQITWLNPDDQTGTKVVDRAFGVKFYQPSSELLHEDGLYKIEVWVNNDTSTCLFVGNQLIGCTAQPISKSQVGAGYLMANDVSGNQRIIVCDPLIPPKEGGSGLSNVVEPPQSFRGSVDISCPQVVPDNELK